MTATVRFVLGNLVERSVDVIVNPVNTGFLLGHAGVNGALLAAGGAAFGEECARLTEQAGGSLRVTGAGRLQAKHVIHAVSPIWADGGRGEQAALRLLHERTLETAAELKCRTVAFPAIGCGAHQFPPEVAAEATVPAVEEAVDRLPEIERVEFAFLSRMILHDYAARSRSVNGSDFGNSVLREEIVELLQDPVLARQIVAVTDDDLIREIHEAARRELDAITESSSRSISVSAIYAAATRTVLGD